MDNRTEISFVCGTYNRLPFLKTMVSSLKKDLSDKDISYEIIIIDGGSNDGTIKWLAKQKDIVSVIQHNRGRWLNKEIEFRSWGYFINLGFKISQSKYICMLSDDCLVLPGSIVNGYKLFEEKLFEGYKIGGVAFYWRNWPEQDKYRIGLTLGDKIFINHGIFLKKALEDVGFADEETYKFYHADGDLCLKLWHKGYEIIDSPDSYIEHCSHLNLKIRKKNNEKQKKDWENYLKKWEGVFYDPIKKNTGGWIVKEYFDSKKTYKKFGITGIKIIFYNYLKKLIKKIKEL